MSLFDYESYGASSKNDLAKKIFSTLAFQVCSSLVDDEANAREESEGLAEIILRQADPSDSGPEILFWAAFPSFIGRELPDSVRDLAVGMAGKPFAAKPELKAILSKLRDGSFVASTPEARDALLDLIHQIESEVGAPFWGMAKNFFAYVQATGGGSLRPILGMSYYIYAAINGYLEEANVRNDDVGFLRLAILPVHDISDEDEEDDGDYNIMGDPDDADKPVSTPGGDDEDDEDDKDDESDESDESDEDDESDEVSLEGFELNRPRLADGYRPTRDAPSFEAGSPQLGRRQRSAPLIDDSGSPQLAQSYRHRARTGEPAPQPSPAPQDPSATNLGTDTAPPRSKRSGGGTGLLLGAAALAGAVFWLATRKP